jgi:hypothetical protein
MNSFAQKGCGDPQKAREKETEDHTNPEFKPADCSMLQHI